MLRKCHQSEKEKKNWRRIRTTTNEPTTKKRTEQKRTETHVKFNPTPPTLVVANIIAMFGDILNV